jgi:hypothetical protein
MSSQTDNRTAAQMAHTALVLSGLMGDRICAVIPAPNEEANDDIIESVLDDMEEVRLATEGLIGLLRKKYPDFAADYATHEARMNASSDRHNYARAPLKLSGHDPDIEGEQKGGAA